MAVPCHLTGTGVQVRGRPASARPYNYTSQTTLMALYQYQKTSVSVLCCKCIETSLLLASDICGWLSIQRIRNALGIRSNSVVKDLSTSDNAYFNGTNVFIIRNHYHHHHHHHDMKQIIIYKNTDKNQFSLQHRSMISQHKTMD